MDEKDYLKETKAKACRDDDPNLENNADDGEDDFFGDPAEGTPLNEVMMSNGILTLEDRRRYARYDPANPGCSKDNPVFIDVTEDYVRLEYEILERLLRPVPFRFVDYKVEMQRLICCGERRLDVLTVKVYTHSQAEFKGDGSPVLPERKFLGTEEYWFDVTAGFEALDASSDED